MRSLSLIMLFACSACTLSFQNISTHGRAEDIVDEDFKTDPKVDTKIKLNGV